MSVTNERDQALSILDLNLNKLSKLYKECYLSMGKGGLLVYAQDVLEKKIPNEDNYRTKEELLEVFDSPSSQTNLVEMVDNYDPKKQGILTLITSYSNATFFVTVNLK
ncbi:hypothetical protein [Methyloprofundus sp.]|uniref:hypothetical protein n=1 Tax=Methyloprofundus sp. TaxID=2020875 RepID=UPI003D0EC545